MTSDLKIREQVRSGKLSVQDAISRLKKLPGGTDSRTYKRLVAGRIVHREK
jgi:hypothetical protein